MAMDDDMNPAGRSAPLRSPEPLDLPDELERLIDEHIGDEQRSSDEPLVERVVEPPPVDPGNYA